MLDFIGEPEKSSGILLRNAFLLCGKMTIFNNNNNNNNREFCLNSFPALY